MKDTYRFIFTLISFFITAVLFAQELSDQETGFDIEQVTAELKEQGITDTEELIREIDGMREMHTAKFLATKEIEDAILQQIKREENAKRTIRTGEVLEVPQSEKEALIALYNSTNGASWTNKTGWDFDTPVTNAWYGVTVTDGHVTSLSLPTNNLAGVLPPEIGQLKKLRSLNFGSLKYRAIALTGSIPPEIGQLTQLQSLDLSFNRLTGSIPSGLWALTKLQSLNLRYNQLTGGLPTEIGSPSEIVVLNLEQNKLTGSIPPEIAYFSSKLKSLSLNDNRLTGPIPEEIGQLTNLTGLYLGFNRGLTGFIPSEIGQLSQLQYLDLTYNALTGSIPPEIGQLTQLRRLLLSTNGLEGSVPDLSRLSAACWIRLSINKFRFTDFAPQFLSTKQDIAYRYQAEIDPPRTLTRGIGTSVTMTMYEDDNYLPDETFQWYRNRQVIPGATSRHYTISNITALDNGTYYYCLARHPILTSPVASTGRDLVLQRSQIWLYTTTCTPVTGSIVADSANLFEGNTAAFSFNTTAVNITYKWTFYTVDNTIESEIITATAEKTYTAPGDYKVSLEITNINGCTTTFDKVITVKKCIPISGEIKISKSTR